MRILPIHETKKSRSDGARTRLQVLEAAASCIVQQGLEKTTFQRIADRCGVSQPLVVHYFKKKALIFPTIIDYLLQRALQKTATVLNDKNSPEEKLQDYIRVSFQLFRETPETAKVYLTLFYLAGFDPKYEQINSEIKTRAVERIAAILEEGNREGTFRVKAPRVTAKTIHNSLVGLLLSTVTEKPQFSDKVLLKEFERFTFRIIRQSKKKGL